MRHTDIVALVAYVTQLNPAQKFDEFTADAWADVLGDLPADLDTARQATARVARRLTWISPGEIRSELLTMTRPSAIRSQAPALEGPSKFEPDEDRAERIRRGAAKVRAELNRIASDSQAGTDEADLEKDQRVRRAAVDHAARRRQRSDVEPMGRPVAQVAAHLRKRMAENRDGGQS